MVFSNGGFEEGDFTDWELWNEEYWSVTPAASHSGTYGAMCDIINDSTEMYHTIDLTGISSVSCYMSIPELTIAEYGYLLIRVELYSVGFSQYIGTLYDEELTIGASSMEWTKLELDTSIYSGEAVLYIYIHCEDGGGDDTSATIYFDDFTLTEGASWDGFKNGDFELGTLENWTAVGNATIDISVVHGGTYSCALLNSHDSIKQPIDLTDTEQLNVYINVPYSTGHLIIDIDDLYRTNYSRVIFAGTTDGWYQCRMDTSGYSGIYVIEITTYGASAYIDDVSVQYTHDSTGNHGNFDTGDWYHYVSAWNGTSTTSASGGIDNSRCAYIDPSYTSGGSRTASIYTYVDIQQLDTISFSYRIPAFDKGYANMGGAWLKIKFEGATTETYTIATATVGGSITDWTTYTVNVSHLTGLYKITIYGETTDAGYTLHPTCTAYVDDIILSTNINLITELCLYQYIDDGLITDMGHDVFEITDTGKRRISHRLTDIGHHLIFPVVTSRDDLASFIDKTINITTRMIMKLRRVKP